jgi:hypothetical protein
LERLLHSQLAVASLTAQASLFGNLKGHLLDRSQASLNV